MAKSLLYLASSVGEKLQLSVEVVTLWTVSDTMRSSTNDLQGHYERANFLLTVKFHYHL